MARPIVDPPDGAQGSDSAPHRSRSQDQEALLRLRHDESDAAGATIAVHAVLGAGTVTAAETIAWSQESLVDDGVTIARVEARGSLRVTVARSTELVVVAVRHGEVEVHERQHNLRLGAGELLLVPLGGSLVLAWDSARLEFFSIPPAPLARLLGVDTAEVQLQAPLRRPRSGALAAYFDRAAHLLLDETFEDAEVYQCDLIRSSAVNLLAAVIIETFDLVNRTERKTDRDQAVIHRAVKFMRLHLRDPISMPEVAEVSGVSIRGLQLIFRRQLSTTPLMHLRQMRLEAARRQLLRESREGTTIASVAASFGYSNPARFSTHYRNAFQHSPTADMARIAANDPDEGHDGGGVTAAPL